MDFRDYLNNISFRFLQPDRDPIGFYILGKFMDKFGISLEMLNTRLPENSRGMKRRLKNLLIIPRMSTFAIGAIINRAVSEMSDGVSFVNVGTWNGFTFLSGMIENPEKKCIGVDNFSQFGGPRENFIERFNHHKSSNHYFFDMDYKDYFSTKHKGEIGIFFFDCDHIYENQLQGLETAEPYFSKDCIIIVDDTNRDGPRRATLDFVEKRPGKYQIILDKPTYQNMQPTFWNGIIIIQKIQT
jgi:hypothetical protein